MIEVAPSFDDNIAYERSWGHGAEPLEQRFLTGWRRLRMHVGSRWVAARVHLHSW